MANPITPDLQVGLQLDTAIPRQLEAIVGAPYRIDDACPYLRHRRAEARPAAGRRRPAGEYRRKWRRSCSCCAQHRVPFVPRGAGTGYTGGAVPMHGGVVISLERMNRILEIDEANLLAVVEPNVITGDLQDAVEKVGLFYPPDPASLQESVIGGNVAECAGGPRAFKYGTTKQYVLGLEACCRPARSSRPAARSSRTSSATT